VDDILIELISSMAHFTQQGEMLGQLMGTIIT